MKKNILALTLTLLTVTFTTVAQGDQTSRNNYIRSGFYLKLGPVFPVGPYAQQQTAPVTSNLKTTQYLTYQPAKIGAAIDLGYLIYIGPSFANKHLRAGIDVTFLNAWFNSTSSVGETDRWKHFYYNVGQKIGPVFTINPVDRLMIDLSYKVNANLGIYYGEWDDFTTSDYSNYGVNFFRNEISMSLRYRVMVLSFQYNFGENNYDNLNTDRTKQSIHADTFRLLFGVKF